MNKEKKNTTTKMTILQRMRQIDQTIQTDGLNPATLKKLKSDLAIASNYLGVNHELSAIFSMVLVMCVNEQAPVLHDISNRGGLDVIDFMPQISSLDTLVKEGFLKKRKARHRQVEEALRGKVYTIDEEIMNAIIRDLPLPKKETEELEGSIEIFQLIYDWMHQVSDNEMGEHDFMEETEQLLKQNQHYPIIKELSLYEMPIEFKIVLIYTMWRSICGYNSIDLEFPCETVTFTSSRRIRMMQRFAHGDDPLSKEDLIEVKEGRMSSDLDARLSDKSIKMLELENIHIKERFKKGQETMKPEQIIAKSLFFNEEEDKQWQRIHSLLEEENFRMVNERMSAMGMKTGFTILFHGSPGTGKTESVLQLARMSGREIMKVDASMTKSMWFGESEKLMKRIFTSYEELRKSSEKTPILFFNEADAILSKRKVNGSSNVSQTENALQNILLEALENFNGIFIATTNLIQNLDEAFDRRFIYKMCFYPPEVKVAAQIWKQNMPTLADEDCLFLAQEFTFSGGQIDNVIRKCEIEHVLTGVPVDLENIKAFCDKEILLKKASSNPIGF
jgi:SpoVK/Ycf46/Vps4 family AAA+-type ATPase